ncbi:hypothetical protein HW571_29560 [Agrobacterium genomosp. 3]|jgi:hypothetical protein|uniref:hypothetical protein n=1 Tax=Agrobacterium TaxID=357 RepID=UPI001CD8FE99|nr:hypothetical protein [Agrobacterium pusense]MCA1869744.1 hypothetical protein [Agrobacterium tomkonis]MCA1880062.1 hypothetical protein [Agrobacterium tumefaciens]MCA1895321.1 hypothetical protein [Agrobacterium tomkonis]MDH0118047.1 hypothetical protein [Agrobacterium pusense]
MPKQTKPFIVEIKPSRKLKTANPKPSIWGSLDLTIAEDHAVPPIPVAEPAPAESGGRV